MSHHQTETIQKPKDAERKKEVVGTEGLGAAVGVGVSGEKR